MSRDPMLLLSIQVALLGAVLVGGLFYMWRVMSRLETKIEELAARDCSSINAMSSCPMMPVFHRQEDDASPLRGHYVEVTDDDADDADDADDNNKADTEDDTDNEDDADGMMRACFGDMPIQSLLDEAAAAFMMFKGAHQEPEGVVLEEIDADEPAKPLNAKKAPEPEPEHDDGSSMADTEHTANLSRTKLRKMTLDALRDMCEARGLSTDGIKNALVERILASVPSA